MERAEHLLVSRTDELLIAHGYRLIEDAWQEFVGEIPPPRCPFFEQGSVVLDYTTMSAGQCFWAAISVGNSCGLFAKADPRLGIRTTSPTNSRRDSFCMNSLILKRWS